MIVNEEGSSIVSQAATAAKLDGKGAEILHELMFRLRTDSPNTYNRCLSKVAELGPWLSHYQRRLDRAAQEQQEIEDARAEKARRTAIIDAMHPDDQRLFND